MRKRGLELTKLRSSAPEKQLLQPVEHAAPAFDRGNGFEGLIREHVAGVAAREEIGGVLGAELDEPLAGRQQRAPIAMRVARQQVDKPALYE